MKKVIGICLIAGLLVGCSAVPQDPETTVIYKRQLYETIFEWACYRQAAIIGYSKLHNVSMDEAAAKVDRIVKDAKEDKFEAWYQKLKEEGKI